MGWLADWFFRRRDGAAPTADVATERAPLRGEAAARLARPGSTAGAAPSAAGDAGSGGGRAAAAAAAGGAILGISVLDALVADRATHRVPDPNDPTSAGARDDAAPRPPAETAEPSGGHTDAAPATFDLGWGDADGGGGGGGGDGGDGGGGDGGGD